MPNVEIKHRHDILTPPHVALTFVDAPRMAQPDLFTESLGNVGFCGDSGHFTTIYITSES